MIVDLGRGFTCTIDDSDAWVTDKTWRWGRDGVSHCFTPAPNHPRRIRLSRYILNAKPGEYVVFLDDDKSNLRRSNMRLVSRATTIQRQAKKPDRTSQYKGVSKKGPYWYAVIRTNGKSLHLGLFPTEDEAALAYNQAALSQYGPAARLNEVKE